MNAIVKAATRAEESRGYKTVKVFTSDLMPLLMFAVLVAQKAQDKGTQALCLRLVRDHFPALTTRERHEFLSMMRARLRRYRKDIVDDWEEACR